jgi:hypothetical protein
MNMQTYLDSGVSRFSATRSITTVRFFYFIQMLKLWTEVRS